MKNFKQNYAKNKNVLTNNTLLFKKKSKKNLSKKKIEQMFLVFLMMHIQFVEYCCNSLLVQLIITLLLMMTTTMSAYGWVQLSLINVTYKCSNVERQKKKKMKYLSTSCMQAFRFYVKSVPNNWSHQWKINRIL